MEMRLVTDSMRKKAAEAEYNSEKADLLAKIDSAIKCGTDNLLSSIDRLASNKKQICDLKQLRFAVLNLSVGAFAPLRITLLP